jgi:hypothetical protein
MALLLRENNHDSFQRALTPLNSEGREEHDERLVELANINDSSVLWVELEYDL